MQAGRSAVPGVISELLAKITSYDFCGQNFLEPQEKRSVFSNYLQSTMMNRAKG